MPLDTQLPQGIMKLGASGERLVIKVVDNGDGTYSEVFSGGSGGSDVTYDSGLSAVLDGAGTDIAIGIKGDLEVPFNCTLGHLTGLFDAAGTFTMDILKSTGVAYPTFTSVSGGPIAMGGAVKYSDSDLTGWTLAFNQGDVLRFNLTACVGVERASVNLRVRKTS